MADINTALADPATKVSASLATGATLTSLHPALHVEERQQLEALRVKVINDDATATAVVYLPGYRGGSNIPVTSDPNYTWAPASTASVSIAINAAIAKVAGASTPGGSVAVLGPLGTQSAPIYQRTGVKLFGEGTGTILKASADFTGTDRGQIMLLDNTVHATTLTGFTLDGNNKECHGIHYKATGGQVFSSPAPDTNPDAFHIVRDMHIRGQGDSVFAGYGLITEGGNLRACRYDTIRVLGVSGCCVWVKNSVDSHYHNIDCGSAGGSNSPALSTSTSGPVGYGMFINGDDNMFEACKPWFSDGDGWYVAGVRNSFSTCHSQDNGGYGWNLVYGKNTYASCTADSNGRLIGAVSGGVTRGRDGWNANSSYNSITGCQSFDKDESGTSWQQQYGVRTGGGLINSDVGIVTYGNALGAKVGTPDASSRVFIVGD